ncbi:MAG: hypothetical protein ABIR25_00225 [Sphingomicrobium sp.]
MIAAIATIAFLAAAWAAIVVIAGSLEVNLAKVGAALCGVPPAFASAPIAVRVSQRYPAARSKRVRARPALRAAA